MDKETRRKWNKVCEDYEKYKKSPQYQADMKEWLAIVEHEKK